MDNIDTPLYESRPSKKSMGNAYCIYSDRIELKCRFPFFSKTFVIKKSDLISIDIYKPPVIRTTFWALKLDMADFNEHVGIRRKIGFYKQLRFTPENPEEFVAKAREFLKLNC
ncbi:MAG: hypothetical protein EHM45_24725 [Desulfobacteraceae bacterium]|nr:MAG: hypothetical protein EHM45_24725 [Desulfobacteraceae bacterium]